MTRSFLLVILTVLLAATPAVCKESTYKTDESAFNKLSREQTALQHDILESLKAINHPTSSSQHQAECLSELSSALNEVGNYFMTESSLILLIQGMREPNDEYFANLTLRENNGSTLTSLTWARKEAIQQAADCSTSALVNAYAQKVTTFADNGITTIKAIDDHLAAIPQPPNF